jgi:hypothetical protein
MKRAESWRAGQDDHIDVGREDFFEAIDSDESLSVNVVFVLVFQFLQCILSTVLERIRNSCELDAVRFTVRIESLSRRTRPTPAATNQAKSNHIAALSVSGTSDRKCRSDSAG